MPTEIKVQWDTSPTDLAVTGLASLADGTFWQSGALDPGNPSPDVVRVSYQIEFNATPIGGDYLEFRYSSGDEAASNEIWAGNIGTSEGAITSSASVAAVTKGCTLLKVHTWTTNHGAVFKGEFDIHNPGPSWQLLCRPVGESLKSTGHIVRIRYGTGRSQ